MTTEGSSQGSDQTITEQDATSLSQKIEQWSQTLPEGEKALLGLLLVRAQQPEEDTQGFYDSSIFEAASTRSWLSSYVLQARPSWNLGSTAYFVKDSGPSWVNSPRAITGLGREVIR